MRSLRSPFGRCGTQGKERGAGCHTSSMTDDSELTETELQHARQAPPKEALERLQTLAEGGDPALEAYAKVLVERSDIPSKQLRRLEKTTVALPAAAELALLERLAADEPAQAVRLARLAVVAGRCGRPARQEAACEALAGMPQSARPELHKALRLLQEMACEASNPNGSAGLRVLERRRVLVPEDLESRLLLLQRQLRESRFNPAEAEREIAELAALFAGGTPPFETGVKTVRLLVQADHPALAWSLIDALAEHREAGAEVQARALAVARRLEEPGAVARALERAEARFPGERDSGIAAIRALLAVYEFEGALARSRTLVAATPTDPEVRAVAADVTYRAGRFAEAEALYRTLASPQGALHHRLRHSECLMELGRWQEAEAVCLSDTAGAVSLPLRLQAARISRYCGDWGAAEQRLSPLLGEPEVAVEAHRLLAEVRELQDRPEDAYEIRRAILDGGREPAQEANELRYLGYRIGRVAEALDAHAERREAVELRRNAGSASWRPGEPLLPPVVCLAEGGIGDEIRDARWYSDLVAAGAVAVTADPRLSGLLRRSFPELEIISVERTRPRPLPGVDQALSRLADEMTLARLAASGTALLSGDLFWAAHATSQPPSGAYLKPDETLRARWREHLRGLGGRPKIGVFWRSGSVTYRRDEFYTRLADWAPLLNSLEAEWIVLQHDLTCGEIASAGSAGATLRRFEKLDLRNDIEGLAALMAELDAVVGPGSAAAELAGALDIPTLFLMPRCEAYYGWRIADPKTGADRLYRRTRHVVADRYRDGASLFTRAAAMLPAVLALR